MASEPQASTLPADIWTAISQPPSEDAPPTPDLTTVITRTLAFAPLPVATPGAPPAALYSDVGQRLRPSQQHPQRITAFTLEHYVAETNEGESYWVLKNDAAATYLRLSADQLFVWSLMDGQHSLRDLNLAYLQQYGKIAPALVSNLLDQLEDGGFIVGSGTSLYDQVRRQLNVSADRSFWQRLHAIISIGNFQFTFRNLDARLTRFATIVNPIIFHPLALAAYLVISVVGVALFLVYLFSPDYRLVVNAPTQLRGWSLLMLYLAYFVSIFVHELAHALACKRYGREVRRGGLLLYYGLPAFFVDTDDMWLAERHQRVMVSWAGPLATLVVAALCTIAVYFIPAHGQAGGTLVGVLYALALMSFVNSLFNLNPLLELDGYFMLMDWLEIPSLRARAFNFVFTVLPHRLLHPQPLTREEKIFAWFGLLSLIYTAFAIWLGVNFFAALVDWFSGLLGVPLAGWPALLIGAAILALISRRSLTAALQKLKYWLRPRVSVTQ
jgi:putative peptide zinc metalloprotease protein